MRYAVFMNREAESLSEFVETAELEAARRRHAQEAFLARGRASLAEARRTGEYHNADQVLAALQARLDKRVHALRADKGQASCSK